MNKTLSSTQIISYSKISANKNFLFIRILSKNVPKKSVEKRVKRKRGNSKTTHESYK